MDNIQNNSGESQTPKHSTKQEQLRGKDKPTVLPCLFENIPPQLRDCEQFVIWDYARRPDGAWAKLPTDPKTLGSAKTHVPERQRQRGAPHELTTWSDFKTASKRYAAYNKTYGFHKRCCGIGFVFSKDEIHGDPYCGIDIDNCRNPETGEITPRAQEIVKLLNSYTEISPSGTGLKIIIEATKLSKRNRVKLKDLEIEIYDRERYFCLTGQHLDGTPKTIEKRQQELNDLCAQVFADDDRDKKRKKRNQVAQVNGHANGFANDNAFLEHIFQSKNGDKIRRLFNGDTSEYGGDASRADFALCSCFAFWTARDAALMDRLFRQSGLMRGKWYESRGDRGTYGQITVRAAIDACTEVYESPATRQIIKEITDKEMADADESFKRAEGHDFFTEWGITVAHKAGIGIHGNSFCRVVKKTIEGELIEELKPACNFLARIVEEQFFDDGEEKTLVLKIDVRTNGLKNLPQAIVNGKDFASLGWLIPCCGTAATIYPGKGNLDVVRAGMQLASRPITRTVFTHTGVRQAGDELRFLHGGGAIGADGAVSMDCVQLEGPLAGFCLPDPPTGDELIRAVRASLAIRNIGHETIAYTGLAAVYRSPLGRIDFGVHAHGSTGTFKSEYAATLQSHFGRGMNSRSLPGSWSSTAFSLEVLAHRAKDCLLVVDDYCPIGTPTQQQQLATKADFLFRGQGNSAGRSRCRTDGSLRHGFAPRSLVWSTGEDSLRGQSLQARAFHLEFSAGAISTALLTDCQRDAAAGLYAASMAAYIKWLMPRYQEIQARLRDELEELRAMCIQKGGHARTPDITANLLLGIRYFLLFAVDVGAITPEEAQEINEEATQAILEAAKRQSQTIAQSDPPTMFLGWLSAAVTSGRAHIVDKEGEAPQSADAWGWRLRTIGAGENERDEWTPQGRMIGWMDEENLYLEVDSVYAAAQQMATDQGQSVTLTPAGMWKRLHEKHLLASTEIASSRRTYHIRRKFQGRTQRVLHILKRHLTPGESETSTGADKHRFSESSTDISDIDSENPMSEMSVEEFRTDTGANAKTSGKQDLFEANVRNVRNVSKNINPTHAVKTNGDEEAF